MNIDELGQRAIRQAEKTRKVAIVGNFVLSLTMVTIGFASGEWGVAAIGLWGGAPVGVASLRLAVLRWPELGAESKGRRVGLYVLALLSSLALVTLVGAQLSYAAMAVLSPFVWGFEFLLGRDLAVRELGRVKEPAISRIA